jgi:16S rRNA (guanine527-N7)-methyltransferase
MDNGHISVLLEPFLEQPLAPSQLDQISIYIDLLQRWNARINLTAIRTEEEIVPRHFGESLFMARHLFPKARVARTLLSASPDSTPGPKGVLSTPSTSPRVLDIGSGAGFPGIPIKIWAPNIDLTLIESNHKKATFLREVARALRLTDVNVITDRAEALCENPDFPRAGVVTLRAVERFESILPQTLSLLAPNGTLALLIGTNQLSSLKSLSLSWTDPLPIPESHSRVLSIGVHK